MSWTRRLLTGLTAYISRFPWQTAGMVVTVLVCVGLVCGWMAYAGQQSGVDADLANAVAGSSGNRADAAPRDTSHDDALALAADDGPFPQLFEMPQGAFEGGKEWLNTGNPLTMRDLRGKIVIVDFWTYCCINCMHVLPELKAIEAAFPNEVVVIGVHSGKFDAERDSENIRRAIVRYEIEHPVVNDAEMQIWQRFGVHAWPTIAVIDPEGYFLGALSGEVSRDQLAGIVKKLVAHHKRNKTLDETPVQFLLERTKLPPTPLRFPGKIVADEAGERLFIADSNHNRIVIARPDGQLLDVVGTGAIGSNNGGYDKATFQRPQGMALVGNTLYVADTENHLIRTIDLEKKTVATLAGTGRQARQHSRGGNVRRTDLNSPWDLLHVNGALYIAMAGQHQIWWHKLGTEVINVYSGNGSEDIVDGNETEASFAQPSGLAYDGKNIFVADSEGSSIRRVNPGGRGTVSTLVGTAHLSAGRLFEFGDVDGVPPNVRLQHPIGITYQAGALYVADSYNHKIKRISLAENPGASITFVGDGKRGDGLQPLRLAEPEGLTAANGKLYIADTNNHRIVAVDLTTKEAAVLAISGLTPPNPPEPKPSAADKGARITPVAAQKLAAGKSIDVVAALAIPPGYKLNKLAPLSYRVQASEGNELFPAEILNKRHTIVSEDAHSVRFSIPLAAQTGKATIELTLTYGYCRDGSGGLCKLGTARFKVPVEVSTDGTEKAIQLAVPSEGK